MVRAKRYLVLPFLLWVILAFATGAVVQVHAQTQYTLSGKESEITYAMEHPMHSWTGTSKEAKGQISVDSDWKTGQIKIAIPVLSFDSKNGNRDSNMGEAVESYLYSEVVFQSTQVQLDSVATEAGQTRFVGRAVGNLTFHNETRPITCRISGKVVGDKLASQGAFETTLTEFDISLPSLLTMKVKNQLKLTFTIVAYAAKK